MAQLFTYPVTFCSFIWENKCFYYDIFDIYDEPAFRTRITQKKSINHYGEQWNQVVLKYLSGPKVNFTKVLKKHGTPTIYNKEISVEKFSICSKDKRWERQKQHQLKLKKKQVTLETEHLIYFRECRQIIKLQYHEVLI